MNFTLPAKCDAAYPSSIGKDLVVGESSDELLRKVGEPNQAIEEKGYTYYVYYVEPYLLRGFDSKNLFLCDSAPLEDWSSYVVTFDEDRKAQSVLYYMFAGADSQRVGVPGADGLMLPATLYRPRGCGTSREPAIVLLHGWLPSWRGALHDPLLAVSFVLHDPLAAVSLVLDLGLLRLARQQGRYECGAGICRATLSGARLRRAAAGNARVGRRSDRLRPEPIRLIQNE